MKSKLNCNERPMCNITHLSNDIQLLIKVTTSLKYNYFIKTFHRCWRRGDVIYAQTKLKLLYISLLHQSIFHTLYLHLLQKRISFCTQFWDPNLRDGQTERRRPTSLSINPCYVLVYLAIVSLQMQYCFLFLKIEIFQLWNDNM